MKLTAAPVLRYAQQTLPFVAEMHLDGAALQIRGVTREGVEELQALLVKAVNKQLLDWPALVALSERPAVDEAIRGFASDQTEDNAVCMVRAVLEEPA